MRGAVCGVRARAQLRARVRLWGDQVVYDEEGLAAIRNGGPERFYEVVHGPAGVCGRARACACRKERERPDVSAKNCAFPQLRLSPRQPVMVAAGTGRHHAPHLVLQTIGKLSKC